MANISNIRLSGTTYSLKDNSATKTVELTQAEYDALTVKDSNTLYIITDSAGVDLSNYYTKTEVDNTISAATSTKQDTLVSGTNIKTVNNQSLLGSGNITIEGGGSVDQSITSGSTNAVAGGAVYDKVTVSVERDDALEVPITVTVINSATCNVSGLTPTKYIKIVYHSNLDTAQQIIFGETQTVTVSVNLNTGEASTASDGSFWLKSFTIDGNDRILVFKFINEIDEFGLYAANATNIGNSFSFYSLQSGTTTKWVDDAVEEIDASLGGLKLKKLTQAEYDALTVKDSSTLYIIV